MLQTRVSYRFYLLFIQNFLYLLLPISLWAQQSYTPTVVNPLLESWRWKSFPELEGKGIRSIAEDKSGRVWFGLDVGVMEYNGYDWKLHNRENGLLEEAIEDLLVVGEEKIYVCTSKGVFVLNGSEWQSVFQPDTNLDFTFKKLRALKDESIMICTNYGLIHIKENSLIDFYTTAQHHNDLISHFRDVNWILLPDIVTQNGPFANVSDVLEEESGTIWMAITLEEEGVILKFNLKDVELKRILVYELLVSNAQFQLGEEQRIILSKNKKIWVCNSSYKTGITIFDGDRVKYVKLNNLFGGDEYTTDIVETEDGTIWIGSLGKLYNYQKGKWEVYDSHHLNIPANKIVLFPGQDMNMWIAGFKSKIYLLDYSFQRWQTYPNLNFQGVSPTGDQWFLSVDGKVIKRTTENEWIAYSQQDGLMDAPVRIICTSKNQVWAVGSDEGVAATAMLTFGEWKLKRHPTLSWGIDYRGVFEDQEGGLWFGGSVDRDIAQGQIGGVLQLFNPGEKNEKWIHHKANNNGLNQSNAYGIGQSKDGRIWLGGGSLFVFDGKTWQKPPQEHLRQFVNIVHSKNGVLWVGSRYYGVFRYDGETWERYDTESGLSSNTIISIYAKSDSCVWVATENDICRFNGKEWISNVFPADINMSFEGGNLIAADDGAIWINQSLREWKRRAFSYSKTPQRAYQNFNAYRYVADNKPPETRFDIYSEEVSHKGNVLISWKGEDFFKQTPAEKLVYSFRFEGGEWSPFSHEPYHTFTDLASGEHTFEVRGRDIDGNIDETPARINFHVLPPVWQQAWFILLISVFLSIIGAFGYNIITKKQQLERQNIQIQEQKEKLEKMVVEIEELSKAKVNFFTNISHELRTPLSLILGPISKLRAKDSILPLNLQYKFYQIIEQNAFRLHQLIDQLLEVRKIESNTLQLNLVQQNIGLFVEDIVELFSGKAEEKEIDLSFESSITGIVTAFDPDKMEKILVNLLSNAFKYTREGGGIQVSLTTVSNTDLEFGESFSNYVKINVKDSGVGISPEMIHHIFDRFYSSNDHQEGYGIGLAYIRELVHLHKGEICVKSVMGKGSCFSVLIPIGLAGEVVEKPIALGNYAKAAVAETAKLTLKPLSRAIASNKARKRILIVEDSKDMLHFLHATLSENYEVLTAENGEEGIEVARNEEIDIIVSDIMMPQMDGLEFCHYIKKNILTSHIPLILLTAKNKDEHRMQGFDTGADAYVGKPFNPRLLEVRIENLLAQRERLKNRFSKDFILSPKTKQLSSPDEKLMKKLLDMMDKNIDNSKFNVQQMCEEVNLSHMHFIRKVKQLTGKKPSDLFRSFRMKRAEVLLQKKKLNISEVAYMVGYDAPSSFSRAFKKEFGVSPKAYVEENTKVFDPS